MISKVYNKYGRKKTFYGLAIFLSLLHLLFVFIAHQMGISFKLEDTSFKYISERDGLVSYKDKEGNLLQLVIEDRGDKPPDSIANKYHIEYKNKTIKVDNSNWLQGDVAITLSNGETYKADYFTIRYLEAEDLPYELKLINGVESNYDFAKVKPLYWIPFLGIPMIIFGLVLLIYTREMWEFDHMFTVKGGEPTEWALFSSRAGGLLILGWGLLLAFFHK